MATIDLQFIADISQATKQVADFTKGTEKQLDGLSSAFKTFGSVAAGALGAIGIGFSLKKAINEATQLEDSIKSLNFSLKSTGTFTEDTSKAFVNLADELSKVTVFSDDAILSAAALLNTLKPLSAQGLERATKAALDLSAATGDDLSTSIRKVAAALNGNVAALGKQVGGFSEAEKKALSFELVLGKIETRVKGAAIAAGTTFSGAIAILGNNFNNALSDIGNFIIKNDEVRNSLNSLSGVLVNVNQFLTNNAGTINTTVSAAFRALTVIVNNLGPALRIAVSAFITFKALAIAEVLFNIAKAAAIVGFSFKGLAQSINLSKIALISFKAVATFGLTLLIDYLISLRLQTGSFGSVFTIVISRVTQGILFASEGFLKFLRLITDLGAKLPGALGKPFQTISKSLSANIATLDAQFVALGKKVDDLKAKGNVSIGVSGGGPAPTFTGGNDSITPSGNISPELAELRKAQGEYEEKLAKDLVKLQEKRAGLAQSGIGAIGQGSAGVASIAGSAFASFGPQGAAIGAAVQFLAQGPEAVRAQLQGFIDGIPQIIDAVAASIPVVIDVLAANSGKITTALSIQMPIVANRLAIELVKQSPNIARSFANSLIAEAGRIATSIADGVKDALGKITGGTGSAGGILSSISGVAGGIGRRLGFADGGVVPGGAPFTDRIPALLTPGEYVLSRDDVKNLVTNSEKQSAPTRTTEMVTINLQIGQEKLASVIYDLSKRGFRLA